MVQMVQMVQTRLHSNKYIVLEYEKGRTMYLIFDIGYLIKILTFVLIFLFSFALKEFSLLIVC
jgi:hypothetical protein